MTGEEATAELDHVLVVDDDADTRKVLERSLRRLGYEVLLAAGGEEGLKLALEREPGVVLLDIRMPQMDGHTLLRRLASHGLDAAVVVMSGHGDMDDVIDVLRNGAVDYLKKPWAPAELVSAVARAAEIHGQRRRLRAAAAGADSEPSPTATTELRPPAPPDLERAFSDGVAPPRAGEHGEPPTTRPTAAGSPVEAARGDWTFSAILQQIRRGEVALPPFPAVLAELRALLARPDAALPDIVALVERDPELASHVLRITNSARYARGGRVNDLRTAVSRIGLRHVQNLVQTVLTRELHPARGAPLRALQARIWRYSIARAVAMRGLAELSGAQLEPDAAYLAGLLGDVGASFLLWVIGERIAAGSRPPGDADACARGIREQHQEVGAALLHRWELDPVAALIARTHHHDAPPAPPSAYWSLAVLGTALADSLDAGDDPTRPGPPRVDLVERCAVELRIGPSTVQKISDSVRREFDGIMEALGVAP